MGDGDQCFQWQAANAGGELHGEKLEALAILLEAVDPLVEKCFIGQALIEDVPCDRGEPDNVGAGLGP